MKRVGDDMVLRCLWPPFPRVGDVVGCVDRRTGRVRWRACVHRVEGSKVFAVVVPETLEITFKWWWATRAQRQRGRELEARRARITSPRRS